MNNHASRDNVLADSFLRGHVIAAYPKHQSICPKTDDEEIKKKGWWQFWK
jgi:hypothetical protein